MDEKRISELRAERGRGMVSAVGEYTPDELWEALDCIERLRAALQLAMCAMRAPLDDWKGECERKALDAAHAALGPNVRHEGADTGAGKEPMSTEATTPGAVPLDGAVRPGAALAGKYGNVLAPFVELMAAELHANSRKGDRPGWLSMSREVALLEIYWHTAKLSAAVKNNDAAAIREHSADVANMSMMLLDVCGGLQATACEWPTCECAMDLNRCKARPNVRAEPQGRR